jgi:hypothetical protein
MYSSSSGDDGDFDFESLKITGTCMQMEKDYLRLTSPPAPSTVRPEKVSRLESFGSRNCRNDVSPYIVVHSSL